MNLGIIGCGVIGSDVAIAANMMEDIRRAIKENRLADFRQGFYESREIELD